MKVIKITNIHAAEGPAVDVMPDSALQKSGKPFFIPEFAKNFEFKTAVAVHINRLGKNIARRFAGRYYNDVCLCLAIEATDLREALQKSGAPWALATAFDGAIILGDGFPAEEVGLQSAEITVSVDGNELERITVAETLDVDGIIEYVSKYFTLKIGDYILIEASGKSTKMTIDSHIKADIQGRESVNIKVK